ncbi:hypothetical protein, partial [Paenibacillus macerans]|uniref:hypothetical protein n=1 Tax=Paenibacillus macerans TaxID=44252 RepID=UPI0018C276DF
RQGRVEEQSFPRLPMMDRHNLRSLIRYLFDQVYSRRREILLLGKRRGESARTQRGSGGGAARAQGQSRRGGGHGRRGR